MINIVRSIIFYMHLYFGLEIETQGHILSLMLIIPMIFLKKNLTTKGTFLKVMFLKV